MIQATVSGWGTLVAGGKQPDVLQEVNVDTMTNTEVKCVDSLKTCRHLHSQYYIVHSSAPPQRGANTLAGISRLTCSVLEVMQ